MGTQSLSNDMDEQAQQMPAEHGIEQKGAIAITSASKPLQTHTSKTLPLLSLHHPRERMYIGIDPGMHGGMVAIGQTGEKEHVFSTMLCKMDRYSIRNWIQHKVSLVGAENTFALIEKLTGFISGPGEAGNKRNVASAHTMFTLGESYGMLQMILVCARVTFFEIPPHEWQRQSGISTRLENERHQKFKNRIKEHAKRVFPKEHIVLDTCDAFLIANLCKKKHEK